MPPGIDMKKASSMEKNSLPFVEDGTVLKRTGTL